MFAEGFPKGAVMSNRELAEILNPTISGGGLRALVSGSVGDDLFAGGIHKYNFTTICHYDWVPTGVTLTADGHLVRIGYIRNRKSFEATDVSVNGIDDLKRIQKQWYVNSLPLISLKQCERRSRFVFPLARAKQCERNIVSSSLQRERTKRIPRLRT
jgi:hypothetical protein